VVSAADLSFFEIRKAQVKWDKGEIKLKGKIAMPIGISHVEVNPVGTGAISISSLGSVVDDAVTFNLITDNNGYEVKWEYRDKTKQTGITRFKIDWEGEKFKYKKGDFEIKTHHIGADRATFLILEVSLGDQGFSGSFEIGINEWHKITPEKWKFKIKD